MKNSFCLISGTVPIGCLSPHTSVRRASVIATQQTEPYVGKQVQLRPLQTQTV
jgi:hypothetical protein